MLMSWAEIVVGAATASAGCAVLRPRGAEVDVSVGGPERLLFVGSSALSEAVTREIESRSDLPWYVLGVVANVSHGETPATGPWLGPISQLQEIIATTRPTRIVLAPRERRRREAQAALLDARLAGVVVEDPADTLERATGKLPIERLTSRALALGDGFDHLDVSAADLTQVSARAFSVMAAALGLVVGWPVFAIVALAIRLESSGPIFFVQDRLGAGGRSFRLIKFRTMRDGGAHPSEWVSDNAHRITRVGHWLRRFRLDELPQLINVIRGDMNLVGPRPHPTSNGPLFLARIPHYRLRFSVRPGVTGWAQVRYGYANGLEEETEKVRYDLYYIKHRTMWLDLRILVATIAVLLFDGRNHESAGPAQPAVAWPGQRWPATPKQEFGR